MDILLAFAGSKPSPVQTIGYKLPDLPIIKTKGDEIIELPKGHLYHGDSKYLYRQEGYDRYVHYSRDLFEASGASPLDGMRGLDAAKAYNLDHQVRPRKQFFWPLRRYQKI